MDGNAGKKPTQYATSTDVTQTYPPYSPYPELQARVDRLGLQQNVDDLVENGFTVITGIPHDLTARLRAAILASPDPAFDFLGQDPVVAEAVTQEKLLTLAEVSVGRGMLLSQIVGAVKTEETFSFALHVDQNWTPAPFPDHTQMITFCWVTDDSYEDEAGGPTMVVPGSHKLRRHPKPEEVQAQENVIPIIAPKGSVAVWRGETWHASYPRIRPGERVTAHISYTRIAMRPFEDYSVFNTPEWLADKPAAMSDLFGNGDGFGKPRDLRLSLMKKTFEMARM